MQMSPFCWWSLMNWWRTSMCFVLECWTELLVSFMALSLSHSNGTCLKLIPKSFNVAFIHRICAQQLPAAMYPTLAVDSATLFCFLDDHETSDLCNTPSVSLHVNHEHCINISIIMTAHEHHTMITCHLLHTLCDWIAMWLAMSDSNGWLMHISVHCFPKYFNNAYNNILNKVYIGGFVQKYP